MKTFLTVLLAVHGAIHLIGFVKAFDLADIPQLKHPISRPLGVLWLLAGLLFMVAAAFLIWSPSAWWIAVGPALVLSQVAIVTSWGDAKLGTLANVIILVPLAMSLLDLRASSYRSIYRREAARRAPSGDSMAIVTDAEIERLPPPIQTYLRRVGVVGRPHVRSFRARLSGQMKRKPSAAWMTIRAEQYEFVQEPARLFLMQASLYGIPFEALHLYLGTSATMQVRVASLFDIVDARGPKMDQGETVTLFNDLCLLAPAALLDVDVAWEERDEHKVGATFTNGSNTIRAELSFNQDGDLVGFVSNDRYQSADGVTYLSFPWSTPIGDYRDFGGVRLASRGDAVWKEPGGDVVYARFVVEEIEYNVGAESPRLPERANLAL